MTRLVAVAHFPPPVHGMAVAVDDLVAAFEQSMTVRRVSVGGRALNRSGAGYHAARIGRVVRAAGVLLAERHRTRWAFFSCDAGAGMLYTLALVSFARALGYDGLLQHHSYAYLLRRSRVLSAIVRIGGPGFVHLVTAPPMQSDFLALYPGATTRVVGIGRGVPVADEVDGSVPRDRLVLGFLGNVTVEKGIGLALDTARAAGRAGLPVELRVAGPPDPAAARMLADAHDVAVEMVGPVYGPERDRFLDGIDVFLFPSRYTHESFGLVAWEAMGRSRPILAHRSGCLTAEAIGGAGLVVDRDDDFVAQAVRRLVIWWVAPRALAEAGRRAHATAAAMAATSHDQVEQLCRDLAELTELADAPDLTAVLDPAVLEPAVPDPVVPGPAVPDPAVPGPAVPGPCGAASPGRVPLPDPAPTSTPEGDPSR